MSYGTDIVKEYTGGPLLGIATSGFKVAGPQDSVATVWPQAKGILSLADLGCDDGGPDTYVKT